MSKVSFGRSVSFDEAVGLVAEVGKDVSLLFMGEPGIGKSSMLKGLSARLPDHEVAYIDCANLDLGDIAMPFIDREINCTRYYPNAYFKLHTGKPIILMLDELTKASQSVQNMLLPTILERRIADRKLHPDSIVFATGNLLSDGVGDHIKAHAANRMAQVPFRKPTAQEWIKWAMRNNVTDKTIAFVDQYPEVMASYKDESQKSNKYIYNPKEPQFAFASPRSLFMADKFVAKRNLIGDEPMLAALIGTVGESAARDLHSMINLDDKLPLFDSIIADPMGAPIPQDPVATCILTYKAVMNVNKETIGRWMNYLRRLPKENQGVFARCLLESDNAKSAADKSFIEWATENNYIFAK